MTLLVAKSVKELEKAMGVFEDHSTWAVFSDIC